MPLRTVPATLDIRETDKGKEKHRLSSPKLRRDAVRNSCITVFWSLIKLSKVFAHWVFKNKHKKNKCKIISLGTLEIWQRPPASEAHKSHPRRLAPARGGLIRQISHVVPQSSAPVTGLAGWDHKQRIYTGQLAWQRKYKHSHSECTHHVLWRGLAKWRDISPSSVQRQLPRELRPLSHRELLPWGHFCRHRFVFQTLKLPGIRYYNELELWTS